MKHRFTIKELQDDESDEYLNDMRILHLLVVERMSELNMNAPLYERLNSIKTDLAQCINHDKKSII